LALAATSFSASAFPVDNLGRPLEPAALSHTDCGPSAGGGWGDGSVAATTRAGDGLGLFASMIGLADGEACSMAAAAGRITGDAF
jgi:hypothetical protein